MKYLFGRIFGMGFLRAAMIAVVFVLAAPPFAAAPTSGKFSVLPSTPQISQYELIVEFLAGFALCRLFWLNSIDRRARECETSLR